MPAAASALAAPAWAPKLSILPVFAVWLLAVPANAALPSIRVLPATLAVTMAQAAIAACALQGYRVAAVVVDPAGNTRVLIAADGVKSIDIESARRKALTAAALDAPTDDIATKVQASPAFAQILATLNPALFPVSGGLPIHAGTDLLGALAVGGAPGGGKDQVCAQAGLDAASVQLRP